MSDTFRPFEKGAMYGKLSTALIAKTLFSIPELEDKVKHEHNLGMECLKEKGLKKTGAVDFFIDGFGVIEVTTDKTPDLNSKRKWLATVSWCDASDLPSKVWIVVPDHLISAYKTVVETIEEPDIKVISCRDLFIKIGEEFEIQDQTAEAYKSLSDSEKLFSGVGRELLEEWHHKWFGEPKE